jgi:hypothetical protein
VESGVPGPAGPAEGVPVSCPGVRPTRPAVRGVRPVRAVVRALRGSARARAGARARSRPLRRVPGCGGEGRGAVGTVRRAGPCRCGSEPVGAVPVRGRGGPGGPVSRGRPSRGPGGRLSAGRATGPLQVLRRFPAAVCCRRSLRGPRAQPRAGGVVDDPASRLFSGRSGRPAVGRGCRSVPRVRCRHSVFLPSSPVPPLRPSLTSSLLPPVSPYSGGNRPPPRRRCPRSVPSAPVSLPHTPRAPRPGPLPVLPARGGDPFPGEGCPGKRM